MPWPKSSVPKFGNWEKSEDISYSIIFDKARAEKERFLHLPELDSNDFSLDQSLYKDSNVGAGKETNFPDKARAEREKFLPSFQQGKTFTHIHQNVHQNPGVTAGQGASHVSCDKSSGLRTGHSSELKGTSGARVLQEQQISSKFQSDPWNQSDAPPYSSSFSSGALSRQPLQAGAPKEASFFNERQHVDRADGWFQGRLHAKSENAPRRAMYAENPPIVKPRRSQRDSEISDMRIKHTVPKFGEWDSGDGFTAAFNKARNEKSSKYALNPGARAVSLLQTEEDLYKSSEASKGSTDCKKPRGWFPMICCFQPSPQSANL